jgi:predicted TIM-barrel fold metal-dependent hydrolase
VNDYRLVSADGHFNEPGDLWTSRLPAEYLDRAPRIETFDEGEAWVAEGFAAPMPFGWGACAGRKPEEMGRWSTMAEINPGSYDAKARIVEMDEDGVDAEVLYPSGAAVRAMHQTSDPDFHFALVRAYNDFLIEFCNTNPARLGGAMMVPSKDVASAVAETERVIDAGGAVAIQLKRYPHGTIDIEDVDDPLWALVEDREIPVTIHVGMGDQQPAQFLPGVVHFYDAPQRILQFIFSGVLDRFPKLQVVMTEVDAGWVPYFLEQADDNFLRHKKSSLRDNKLTRLPSEYVADHFSFTFITDTYAIENRERIGYSRLMWSNDYPHITSDWPHSWKTINAMFSGVPADERHAMLAGNALRLFKFDQKALAAASV